ncbi:MAG: hypothetical protein ABS76_01855 [Pelagibacterium sp. SCN 64-44]|nr:MAG: hypothetical protein ABS76_01855 [Pelagibacterium sp. SCN 64-44]
MSPLISLSARRHWLGLLTALALGAGSVPAIANSAFDDSLTFDPQAYSTLSVSLDGKPAKVRRYEMVYVAKPIEMALIQPSRGVPPNGAPDTGEGRPLADPLAFHKMIVYVPENAIENDDTAIILHVSNSGWFSSPVADRIEEGGNYSSNSDTDAIGAALGAGYVIVSAGTRSRSALAADGRYAGKAPAPVVDAKAAIRYLRLNDAAMPGSAERIVITGTSGGGGLSAAVAASGNSADYFPYLAEIGAAGTDADGTSHLRDDVFATIAYCPITDLGNADIAYEWQYNGVRSAGNTTQNHYPEASQATSTQLAAAYPAYLESLGLKTEDGKALTAETMREAILAAVKRETEEVLAEGVAVPAIGEDFVLQRGEESTKLPNDWLTVADGKVTDIDYENYLAFVTKASALKIVPAFDATANTGNEGLRGENSLFGGPDVPYASFTEYGWNNNEAAGDGSGPDDSGLDWAELAGNGDIPIHEQLRLINPLAYLGTEADTAPYWYLRHGMVDRDTSFAVELALYYAVLNDASVKDVDFELAWLRPHSGNYDVQEAYAWLARHLEAAGKP